MSIPSVSYDVQYDGCKKHGDVYVAEACITQTVHIDRSNTCKTRSCIFSVNFVFQSLLEILFELH